MQGMSSRQQGKQSVVSQIAEQEDFNSLADEDREHIDEVVCLNRNCSQHTTNNAPVRSHGYEKEGLP